MSWCASPWIYPVWDSLHLLDLVDYFLSHISEVINSNLFKYFLSPFLFLFFFWDPYNRMLVRLMLSQRSVRLSSILFIPFSLFSSVVVISTILSSRSLILSSASGICYWFLLEHFKFHLLCCSSLFVCSLVLLGPC